MVLCLPIEFSQINEVPVKYISSYNKVHFGAYLFFCRLLDRRQCKNYTWTWLELLYDVLFDQLNRYVANRLTKNVFYWTTIRSRYIQYVLVYIQHFVWNKYVLGRSKWERIVALNVLLLITCIYGLDSKKSIDVLHFLNTCPSRHTFFNFILLKYH